MKKTICLIIMISMLFAFSSCADITYKQVSESVVGNTEELKDQYSVNTENGFFVRENVPVNSQYMYRNAECNLPRTRHSLPTVSGSNLVLYPYYVIQTILRTYEGNKEVEKMQIAVVKKTGTKSYYKKYEDGTELAYTVSEVEITGLPEKDYGMKTGDVIEILENYAFSPDDPDIIVFGLSNFNYVENVFQTGILEFDKEYVVVLYPDDYYSVYDCYSYDKEKYPDDMCFHSSFRLISGDIYPYSIEDYNKKLTGELKDLCIPYGANGFWNSNYDIVYNEFILKK